MPAVEDEIGRHVQQPRTEATRELGRNGDIDGTRRLDVPLALGLTGHRREVQDEIGLQGFHHRGDHSGSREIDGGLDALARGHHGHVSPFAQRLHHGTAEEPGCSGDEDADGGHGRVWLPPRPVKQSPPPRRVLLIANPISGGGRARALAPRLAAELAQRGVHAEVHFTSAAGDGAARARTAADEAWDGIVAMGGDGTINELLNGMPDPGRALGVFPIGTANVLAKELRLPDRPETAAATIAAGHRRSLAIGECNGRRFLLFVGAGIDGSVVQRLSAVRTGTLGKHKWLGPILHTVWHWPRHSLVATFADGTRLEGLSSVLATRVRNYGGVMQLTPDIDPDDGFLHVLCFRASSRTRWVWMGAHAILGRLRPGPLLEVKATTAVRIDGSAPFQIDGDHGGSCPADLRVMPVRASIWAPAVNQPRQ